MTSAPYIETESVRSALDAMRQAEALEHVHPLVHFLTIQQLNGHPGQPAANDGEIFDSLSYIIRRRLNHHRRLQQLPAVDRRAGTAALQEGFGFHNDELEAWSVLYYRFVRVDLDLSIDQMEKITGQPTRTLTRRQSRGITRLTHELNRRERRIRRQQQKIDLRAHLLLAHDPQPLGRETLIQTALERLSSPTLPRHLLLYGARGVGKTTLALAVAHRLIDQVPLKNTAWIDPPATQLDHLIEQIALKLGIPLVSDSRFSLASYLQLVDTLIVLDNAAALIDKPDTLGPILQMLSAARLIICAPTPPTFQADVSGLARLQVPDLDKDAAFDFMAHEAKHLNKSEDLDLYDQLYNTLGGNPFALWSALRAGKRYDPSEVSINLYQPVWENASPLARLVWLMLALSPAMPVPEDQFSLVLPDAHPADLRGVIADLDEVSVFEPAQRGGIMLTPLARSFANRVVQDPAQQPVVQQAVRLLADHLAVQPDATACLQLLTSAQTADLPTNLLLDLAYTFAPIMEYAGVWTAWRAYLEPLLEIAAGKDRLWVGLHLGITYRWLAQWSEAEYLLSNGMNEAGQAGAFAAQADAMVELAAVYRYERRYDLVKQLLRQASRYYRRANLPAKIERVSADHIQMALEMGDMQAAQQYLLDAVGTWQSPRLITLIASAALRTGDLSTALDFAQRAYQQLGSDLPHSARVTALLGQIYYQLGNRSAAIDHLTCAITVMEQTHDLIGCARTRMNLGAVYLGQGNLRAALRYLRDLPDELERLGDIESLEAASQNLEMLNHVTRHWKVQPFRPFPS